MRIILFLSGLLLPASALAVDLEDYFPCGGYFFCRGVGAPPGATALQLALMIVERVVGLVSLICFIAIVYGAIRIITARGQSEGLEGGKKAIQWAVFGFIAVTLAASLVEFVQGFFVGI